MPTQAASVTREHIESYIEWLQAWAAPATVAGRHRSLRQFFTYLVEEGECERHPMDRIPAPAIPEKEVPVLDDEQIADLYDTCRKGTSFTDRRDYAILRLFIDSGLRLAEMANLKVTDLDLKTNTVFVQLGKGRKPRTAVYGDRTAQTLERYLRVRAKHHSADRPELWLAPRGVYTRHGIIQMVERRGEQAGLDLHCHVLRHTAAHRCAAAGMQETDMMRLFGWRSSEMPKRYGASAAAERAIEAYRRLGIGSDL
jgi:site-specific recombinase XerD